jgi:hypothetical protein
MEQITPHTNMQMVEMIVDVRPDALALPDGNPVRKGESTICVYKDSVALVEALVETETDKLKQAEAHFEAELEEFMGEKRYDREKALETFGGSIPASFRSINKRDILPLRSAKVTKTDIPPPEVVLARNATSIAIEEIMTRIAPVLGSTIGEAIKDGMKGKK